MRRRLSLRIDFDRRRGSFGAVSCFRHKLVAVCVLAFWLVATHHCRLESLGSFASHTDDTATTGCCASSDGCTNDECGTLEEGSYRIDGGAVKVFAPRITLICHLNDWRMLTPAQEMSPRVLPDGVTERPKDWLADWQFVRRAAAPAHAPDSLSA